MLSGSQKRCAAAVAKGLEMEAAAVLAVVDVESGGQVFARVAGREEPLIRWEAHYFDRLCNPSVRERARAAGLSSPIAGAIANPPSQAARWALLERAAALDHDAAYASASWGIGQVMGAHWHILGYENVDALVADARSGFAGQLRLMMRFITITGLSGALRALDWSAFARGYNGPRYRELGYDTRLARAYEAISTDEAVTAVTAPLSRGAGGDAVSDLQRSLIAAGYQIAVDGAFGPETEKAVNAFQSDRGLAVDGIAGPQTMAALADATQPDARVAAGSAARFLRWIAGLLLPGYRV